MANSVPFSTREMRKINEQLKSLKNMEKTENEIRKLTSLGSEDNLIRVDRPHFERLKLEVEWLLDANKGGQGYVVSGPDTRADYIIFKAYGEKTLIYTLEPAVVEDMDEITIDYIIQQSTVVSNEDLRRIIENYGEQEYERGSSAQFYGSQR